MTVFSSAVGRLLEILDAYLNPPVQEPVNETEEIAEAIAEAVAEAEAEIAEAIVNGQQQDILSGPTAQGGLSLRFMQESELENDPASFGNGPESVESESNAQGSVETTVSVSVEVKETYVRENGAEVRPIFILLICIDGFTDCRPLKLGAGRKRCH